MLNTQKKEPVLVSAPQSLVIREHSRQPHEVCYFSGALGARVVPLGEWQEFQSSLAKGAAPSLPSTPVTGNEKE